jgi:drug/metabolite transporter (DMT)-like permease
MDALEQLFTIANIIFCLVIALLVWAMRWLVEKRIWKNAVNTKWWSEFFMHLAPLGVGAALAASISEYPYPEGFSSLGSRLLYGVVCGMASGTVFRIAKKMWWNKEQNAGPSDDIDLQNPPF